MSSTLYLTIYYDPSRSHSTDPAHIYRDVVALKFPPPKKSTFEVVSEHSFMYSWELEYPRHKATRIQVISSKKKQMEDEKVQRMMSKMHLLRTEWSETKPPSTPSSIPVKRANPSKKSHKNGLLGPSGNATSGPPTKRARTDSTMAPWNLTSVPMLLPRNDITMEALRRSSVGLPTPPASTSASTSAVFVPSTSAHPLPTRPDVATMDHASWSLYSHKDSSAPLVHVLPTPPLESGHVITRTDASASHYPDRTHVTDDNLAPSQPHRIAFLPRSPVPSLPTPTSITSDAQVTPREDTARIEALEKELAAVRAALVSAEERHSALLQKVKESSEELDTGATSSLEPGTAQVEPGAVREKSECTPEEGEVKDETSAGSPSAYWKGRAISLRKDLAHAERRALDAERERRVLELALKDMKAELLQPGMLPVLGQVMLELARRRDGMDKS